MYKILHLLMCSHQTRSNSLSAVNWVVLNIMRNFVSQGSVLINEWEWEGFSRL